MKFPKSEFLFAVVFGSPETYALSRTLYRHILRLLYFTRLGEIGRGGRFKPKHWIFNLEVEGDRFRQCSQELLQSCRGFLYRMSPEVTFDIVVYALFCETHSFHLDAHKSAVPRPSEIRSPKMFSRVKVSPDGEFETQGIDLIMHFWVEEVTY